MIFLTHTPTAEEIRAKVNNLYDKKVAELEGQIEDVFHRQLQTINSNLSNGNYLVYSRKEIEVKGVRISSSDYFELKGSFVTHFGVCGYKNVTAQINDSILTIILELPL